MTRESNCEHDIGFYRVVGGDGLDVVEACGECGERITSESPKTVALREEKEEQKEKRARKAKRAARKREAEKEESKTNERNDWY